MSCFDAWDIGGCGCGPAPCTNAASFSVGGSNTCCICVSNPLMFTLNAAFAGQTSFTLTGSESSGWPSSYVSTIDYGPNDSTGTPVAFFSNCFTDGTHSYYWVYDGQPVLFKFTGTSCNPALYVGNEVVSQSGFSGYQCSPSFTGTYTVTSGQTVLYAAGVRSVAVAGSYGYPLCCMWNTKVIGCSSTSIMAAATVNWWTSSAMTTLISTGAGGQLGVGSAGTWYRQIIAPRFTTVAANKAVTCGGNDTTTLSVAAGYHCFIGSGCGFPAPSTLHCTFYYAGGADIHLRGWLVDGILHLSHRGLRHQLRHQQQYHLHGERHRFQLGLVFLSRLLPSRGTILGLDRSSREWDRIGHRQRSRHRMNWETALAVVIALTGHERYRVLCSDSWPDHEAYRALMVRMATGEPATVPSLPPIVHAPIGGCCNG